MALGMRRAAGIPSPPALIWFSLRDAAREEAARQLIPRVQTTAHLLGTPTPFPRASLLVPIDSVPAGEEYQLSRFIMVLGATCKISVAQHLARALVPGNIGLGYSAMVL